MYLGWIYITLALRGVRMDTQEMAVQPEAERNDKMKDVRQITGGRNRERERERRKDGEKGRGSKNEEERKAKLYRHTRRDTNKNKSQRNEIWE